MVQLLIRIQSLTLLVAALVLASAAGVSAQIPIFPGAQGHGTKTVAGSGRHLAVPNAQIFRITNLNDSGPGSLRECGQATMPRVCIFETSGRIHLLTEFRIKYPYITIAGQTAPAPGVMVTGTGIRVAAHNVLIQHLEVRPGDGSGIEPDRRDGITVAGGATTPAYNVVIDHVSVSWGLDENLSVWHPLTKDVTISNSIIAEGLEKSIHPDGLHSKGVMVADTSTRISIHNNLIAHNWDRNPRLQAGASVEFVNNVVYNWGGPSGWNGGNVADTSSTGVPVMLNFVGNYYKRGRSSPSLPVLYGKPVDSKTRMFAHSNYGPTRTSDTQDDWLITSLPTIHRSTSPVVASSGLTTRTAAGAYEYVLGTAGSRPKARSAHDARVVADVRNGTGDIKDCISGCTRSVGGWPSIPVVRRALTIPAAPFGDADGDKYTNLEEWLHGYSAQLQ